MPCFRPLIARMATLDSGKKKLYFARQSYPGSNWSDLEEVRIPCGQCIGCRIERSRQWAVRCEHEAQLHQVNSFVTLTYDDDHLPPMNSLRKRDLQLFFKRLRKKFGSKSFRYFACGEYGGSTARPHYHVILFGLDFPDKIFYKIHNGQYYYNSPVLSTVWPFGFSVIGEVTFESCAYVARYTCKKSLQDDNDKIAEEWLKDALDIEQEPEFLLMSRRPGIGQDFCKKYLTSIYNCDTVITRNKVKCRPPRYYDDIWEQAFTHNVSYEKNGFKDLALLKAARRERASRHDLDNTFKRLADREEVLRLKALKLKRGYENE